MTDTGESAGTRFAENDGFYKRMIEEIKDYAIILMDTNGIIRNWNKGAEKIKQYSENEIIGKHFSIFYLNEDIESGLPHKLINQSRESGSADHEGWRKRKDGSKFWGGVTITAIHDDQNNVIGFCKVTRDLTEKKIAEDNLRLSEQRYHGMIAEVQDYAIILLSAEGIIENWNAGAEKIKGYSAKEVIGRKFELFYTAEDRNSDLPNKLLSQARSLGRATHEGWRVRKDGSEFWGIIVITALHNKNGEIIGFSKVTRDLTEKKIAEEKLAAYTAELEIQNGELEQFAYVASHDLQEPLRKIRTFTELILENIDDKEYVKNYLTRMEAAAVRMSQMIKSLLNYSRLSQVNQEQYGDKIDLNMLLDRVKEDYILLIHERKAILENDSLPTILGSTIQIEQLFSNLIGNSLKFCLENPVLKINSVILKDDHIQDKLQPGKRYVKLSFTDNGIGFESQYKEQIFGLFQRLHGKQTFAGTGIGLALCKKITEQHGGIIDAESEPGKGATFNVYLPAMQET